MNTLLLAFLLIGQSGYAGSPLPVVDIAFGLANVQKSDIVYDIGSGDGRIVCFVSKKYKCKSVGIELDANLANLSAITSLRNGVSNLVTIKHEDALKTNLDNATIVYIYHQSGFLDLLRTQLESLKPGTKIICLDYPPEWKNPPPWLNLEPTKTIKIGEHTHKIYIWVVSNDDDSPDDSPNDFPKDSSLLSMAKIYPGVQFYNGERNDYLVSLAEQCAQLMAKNGVSKYWRDGHPDWNSRFFSIRNNLGLTGVEVTAFSWPRASNEINTDITRGLFYDWQRSPGHWNVVSNNHTMFGEATAKSSNGVWYGCIICAD